MRLGDLVDDFEGAHLLVWGHVFGDEPGRLLGRNDPVVVTTNAYLVSTVARDSAGPCEADSSRSHGSSLGGRAAAVDVRSNAFNRRAQDSGLFVRAYDRRGGAGPG